MRPDVSAVVVSHRSAREALECVKSLRRAFREEGIAGEVILVDCGSGADQVRQLGTAGADLLLPLGENRGYAGGLNAGLALASSFYILLSNADVVFRTGSIVPLLESVDDPAVGAAAPLAFWDPGDRVRLPPGWAPGFLSDLAQLSAGRPLPREKRRFASFARETLRLWEYGGDARHLTGAALAVRRDVFDRIGRFDERFLFEYEETEWEDRVLARELLLRFVPRARVHHVWGASAVASPDAPARRVESRRVYRRRRYGRLGEAILDWTSSRGRVAAFPEIAQPQLPAREGAWVAISTNPSLLPFAGAPLDSDFVLPEEIIARFPRAPLYLRVFRAVDGQPLETMVWEKK
jgi:GT2 family glycosyltransferase